MSRSYSVPGRGPLAYTAGVSSAAVEVVIVAGTHAPKLIDVFVYRVAALHGLRPYALGLFSANALNPSLQRGPLFFGHRGVKYLAYAWQLHVSLNRSS